MTKRLPAILLLATLVLPTLGGYAWLRYQKSEIRKEVENHRERGFTEEDLVLLRFSQMETRKLLRWEHPAEFEYLGQMYDIVRSEEQGDSLYYWCYWDEEETVLNREIAELEKSLFDTNPQQQEKQERLQQFYKSLISIEFGIPDIPQPINITKPNSFLLTTLPLVSFEPPTPPPRFSMLNC
jgi:hypothetical protein